MKAVVLLFVVAGLLVAPAIAMSRDAQTEVAVEAEAEAEAVEVAAADAESVEIDVASTESESLEAEAEAAAEMDAEATATAETATIADSDAEAIAEADAESEALAEAEAVSDAEAEAGVSVTGANCMSQAGVAMIKRWEGFYPKQYKDVAGIPTIGYGTLCSDRLLPCPGPVTEPQAASVLAKDLLRKYGPCVSAAVKCPVNNNQFSALVSFAYNAGCGALQTVARNNKLGQTTGANLAGVPANMALYNKARVKGKLVVVQGLINRRNAEIALFRSTASSACMAAPVLRSGAPVLRAGTPITQFAACTAIKGTCQTAACNGVIVRGKCGPGAPTCCVPNAPATPVTPTPTTPAAPAAGANCMSLAGLAMVKSFEGFYAKEYKDVAGIPTIGYGTLCRDNVLPCPGPVTEAQAASALGSELVRKYSGCVRAAVRAPLNNNQFSALVSFAYNAGCGAAATVINTAKLNQPNAAQANYAIVPSRMALYNKARVRGVLQVVRGLVRRRAAEGALFVSKDNSQCMAAPVLRSAAPGVTPASTPVPAAGKKKAIVILTAHDLFNLRRGEVDLPSGTHITHAGIPNATHKRIVARADIAEDVHEHERPLRKNRGPIGRWSKKMQWEARHAPVQNE